jgi:hypothetical protein
VYLEDGKNYLKRRLEKEKARNSLRRELYYKNKVDMDYYYKALEERYRRLNEGQQLLQLSWDRERLQNGAKRDHCPLSSNHLPYKQTSFVAIPKMVYRNLF